jgi:DNA gyrase subunit B/topoisomerase-4 subunit B
MRQGQAKAVFVDSAAHGPGSGAELFVVEGESAAAAVAAVRSARSQAVLPLRGKPMNAWRAGADKVRAHALYAQFAAALGVADAVALEHADEDALASLRFERVVLLMDPDADGIHIGALVLLYLQRWAPALIGTGRVMQARVPMFVLRPACDHPNSVVRVAFTPAERDALAYALRAEHGGRPIVQAVRGLASLAPQWLADHCVDPATRELVRVVTAQDVDAAVAVFGRS